MVSEKDARSSLIGGEDREPGREGGSWMTLSKHGKLAALTNHLSPKIKGDVCYMCTESVLLANITLKITSVMNYDSR